MRTIKVNDYDKLIEHANTLISKNKVEESQKRIADLLPNNIGTLFQQSLSRYEGLVDSSKQLADPREALIAKSLAAVGHDYLAGLADISGELIAQQVALNMAGGNAFGDVRFEVSDSANQRLVGERQALMSEYLTLNRETYMCLAALNSVVNGVPFSMDEYYNAIVADYEADIPEDIYDIDDELTEEISLDDDEIIEEEDIQMIAEDEDEKTLSAIVSKMSAKTGDGFAEITSLDSLNGFTGQRSYNTATMRINMSEAAGLDMDNFRQRLTFMGTPADKQWCVDSVNGMLRSFYGDEKYDTMVADGANMFAGIYLDGKPASVVYDADNSYENKCTHLMRAMLEGGHRLNLAPMEKGADGTYNVTDRICDVEVQPSLEAQEEFSLWKAILRFFGFHIRTRAEKLEERIKFSDMENQEAVENIRTLNRHGDEYNRTIQPLVEAREQELQFVTTVDRYAFGSNFTDPTSYFRHAPECVNFVEASQEHPYGVQQLEALKTLHRDSSRVSLVTLLMLSEGMTLEQISAPDEAAQERMKQIGREFADTVTMPETPLNRLKREHPEYSKEQIIAELQKPEVQQPYNAACAEKMNGITEMYGKIDTALKGLKAALPVADFQKIDSLAACCKTHSFFETASCDVFQTLRTEPVMQGAHKDTLTAVMNFADECKVSCPTAVIAKSLVDSTLRTNLYSDPNQVYTALGVALAAKEYGIRFQKGEANDGMGRAVTMMLAAGFQNEISEIAKRDPDGVITYAKDIISGKKPMPDGIASGMETNFTRCFTEEKQRSAPALQASRTR